MDIIAFVDSLTEEEVRHELLQAYIQMERCIEVLDGKDVEPTEMRDNGRSSDLELFYTCKRKAQDLAMLVEAFSGEDTDCQTEYEAEGCFSDHKGCCSGSLFVDDSLSFGDVTSTGVFQPDLNMKKRIQKVSETSKTN